MQIGKIVAALALCGLTGCGRDPGLQDQFTKSDYRLPFEERLRIEEAAPVIVCGSVLAVNEVGAPRRSPGDSRIKTQLTRIGIAVEEVVKGGITASPLEFYFFTYSFANHSDLGVPRYSPEVGQRRIFFLRPWEHGYRSVGDVTNYNLAVQTGRHPRDFCQGKSPGCCIAELLLVPAQAPDIHWFVHDLGPDAYAAGVLCSPGASRDLLQRLVRNPDGRIAGSAADIMSMLPQWWPQLAWPGH